MCKYIDTHTLLGYSVMMSRLITAGLSSLLAQGAKFH